MLVTKVIANSLIADTVVTHPYFRFFCFTGITKTLLESYFIAEIGNSLHRSWHTCWGWLLPNYLPNYFQNSVLTITNVLFCSSVGRDLTQCHWAKINVGNIVFLWGETIIYFFAFPLGGGVHILSLCSLCLFKLIIVSYVSITGHSDLTLSSLSPSVVSAAFNFWHQVQFHGRQFSHRPRWGWFCLFTLLHLFIISAPLQMVAELIQEYKVMYLIHPQTVSTSVCGKLIFPWTGSGDYIDSGG